MTYTIHLITSELPPYSGGLELWTRQFAHRLSKMGMHVIVYVCGNQLQPVSGGNEFEVVSLASLRSPWEEPLYASTWVTEQLLLERDRLNFLVLRNQLRSRIAAKHAGTHLIISNYSLTVGYLASLVARELKIPHIAMVVGTDFSRGFRNAREKPTVEYVCRTAASVVVRNREQATSLIAELGLERVFCIPTSFNPPATLPHPSRTTDRIVLLSDCGFRFKKGTGVLLDSFQTLLTEGYPVRLILYGDVAPDQMAYWNQRQQNIMERFSPHAEFPGYVTQEDIHAAFRFADIYCSATLGEGSSSSRIAAACSGLPMVTTRCGEIDDDFEGVSHVRLSNVADADGFLTQLRSMVEDIQQGRLRIDMSAVERWRERFSAEREMSAWAALIEKVAGI